MKPGTPIGASGALLRPPAACGMNGNGAQGLLPAGAEPGGIEKKPAYAPGGTAAAAAPLLRANSSSGESLMVPGDAGGLLVALLVDEVSSWCCSMSC